MGRDRKYIYIYIYIACLPETSPIVTLRNEKVKPTCYHHDIVHQTCVRSSLDPAVLKFRRQISPRHENQREPDAHDGRVGRRFKSRRRRSLSRRRSPGCSRKAKRRRRYSKSSILRATKRIQAFVRAREAVANLRQYHSRCREAAVILQACFRSYIGVRKLGLRIEVCTERNIGTTNSLFFRKRDCDSELPLRCAKLEIKELQRNVK